MKFRKNIREKMRLKIERQKKKFKNRKAFIERLETRYKQIQGGEKENGS